MMDADAARRLFDRLEALPGPVWLFGAYGVYRGCGLLWGWLLRAVSGSYAAYGWMQAVGDAIALAGMLLPLWLLALLLRGSRCALSGLRWYAGLSALVCCVSLFAPLFGPALSRLSCGPGEWLRMAAATLVSGGLWLALLLYAERSARLTAVFPAQRPLPKAVVAGMVLLAFAGM